MPPIGMVLASKGEQGENRFAPAFKANDTEDFSAENVIVHHAGGMGFLFLRTVVMWIYINVSLNHLVTGWCRLLQMLLIL